MALFIFIGSRATITLFHAKNGLQPQYRRNDQNALRVSREYRMCPLFFRGWQVNSKAFIDIEEIFTSVDRGGRTCRGPPDRPKKLLFWKAYSVQSLNGWTKWNEISYASYEANLGQSSRGAHSGGVGKGEKSTPGPTWRGSWRSFLKVTLAPASSVSGLLSLQIWSCAH